MSDCSGPDCTHESHNHGNPRKEVQIIVDEPVSMPEKSIEKPTQMVRNPIITPSDPERWPLLEMQSQMCGIPLDAAEQDAVLRMDELLNQLDEEAAGLAAVQIGVPRRIFLLRNGTDAEGKTINNAYINPTLVSVSKETKKDGEACLSLPGFAGRFSRPKVVELEYFDVHGNVQRQTFKGFWARAVMHEMNHLDGVLIIKHFEKEINKQPRRTKFGMRLTPHRVNVIAQRRAVKKRARAAKKHARAIGR
jgi:peptide deformylase